MMAQKREGRRAGWMGGRNGRVFEGGLCESLIPRFHQRVQIWRHLLLHEACSQDPPLTREKTGGWGGGGGRKKERPVGESLSERKMAEK